MASASISHPVIVLEMSFFSSPIARRSTLRLLGFHSPFLVDFGGRKRRSDGGGRLFSHPEDGRRSAEDAGKGKPEPDAASHRRQSGVVSISRRISGTPTTQRTEICPGSICPQ